MKAGSLFTGYGGLDMAAAAVLGCDPAWFCEVDPAASTVLAHHWPHVPNLGDITAVDWTSVEPVDVLTGGFPCQDVSNAGRRAGLKPGTRSGLWEHMAHAVEVLRPRLIIAENVRGLLSAPAHSDVEPCPWCLGDADSEPHVRALGAVLGDLADLGYDAVWYGLRAADIGAPHNRFRVFIVAVAQDADGSARDEWWIAAPGQTPKGRTRPDAGRSRTPVTDADRVGQPPGYGPARPDTPTSPRKTSADRRRGPVTSDTASGRPEGRRACREEDRQGTAGDASRSRPVDWGPYESAIRRWEHIIGRPAPAPRIVGPRGGLVLNPELPEWMMGLPSGHITAVPGLSRADQLKLAGNGVVPQQGAAALAYLLPIITAARKTA